MPHQHGSFIAVARGGSLGPKSRWTERSNSIDEFPVCSVYKASANDRLPEYVAKVDPHISFVLVF